MRTTELHVVIQRYCEKLSMVSIDNVIRDACIEAAHKVADQLIKQYKLKNLIIRKVNKAGVGKDKLIVALEVEKEK